MAARKRDYIPSKSRQFSSPLDTTTSSSFFLVIVITTTFFFSFGLARNEGYDYREALSKSLLYLEAQRSGRLPYNQRVTWRDHSGLTDGLEQGVDLVGGYYDAGDHVKFGLPMAFTVTMLSWSVIEYGDLMEEMGELTHALEAIKWGTDYFIKAHTDPNVLWGSFFIFADKYRGKYDESIEIVKNYYASVSGYKDELLWAALWLHRATDNSDYLAYIVNNADCFGGTGWAITEFSWDVKYAGVQILAAKVLMEGKHKEHAKILKLYQSKAEHYLCSCLQRNNESNVGLTPGGLLFIRPWNNMQYVSSAAFLLIIYSDYLRQFKGTLHCRDQAMDPDDLMDFGKAQVDYILGSNPVGMSYLVGFGPKYPKYVHHRGASVVSYRDNPGFIGCTQGYDNWYSRREPNPNVLVGALVGGPDSKDWFRDDRRNYMQTEACTYNTAPMVGVFAKLYHYRDSRLLPEEDQQIGSY